MIPFLQLTPGPDRAAIAAAIARVIDRGWFILGPELESFENAFAAATGARHSVGVGNGTDALAIALRGAGVSFRNEVITGPGGKQILLEDPSGNPIELFQPAAL